MTRRKHRIRPVSGSEVDWRHTYPAARRLVEDTARPEQVAAMIRQAMEHAPTMTFVAFGRAGYRLLGKTQRLIEDDYHTELHRINLQSGQPGRIAWPTLRHESRLRVDLRAVGEPPPST